MAFDPKTFNADKPPIKVRCTLPDNKYGFYALPGRDGRRIYGGQTFDCHPDLFSDKWMEKIEKKRGSKPKPEVPLDGVE